MQMKKSIFSVLQRIGRSFMLPIAVLPIAGLFLGIGSSLTNEATMSSLHLEAILQEGTFLYQFLTLLSTRDDKKIERGCSIISSDCILCDACHNQWNADN